MTEKEMDGQEVKQRKEDFFELIVSNPNHASPFLQFSWCVNKKGIEYLQEKKVLHPFLLVVILNKQLYSDNWEDYERQLYPLDRGLGHIEFNRSGEFQIHASVVWSYKSSGGNLQKAPDARKEIFDKYLERCSTRYEYELHDYVAYRPDKLDHESLPYHDEIKVLVDTNLFAPEPPGWLKWWVNMFWDWRKPKNQCEWRRRKIIAFTIQPFLVLLWLVIRSVIAVFWAAFPLVVGYYPSRIGWKAIFHPFDMNLTDIFDKYDFKNGDNYWWLASPKRTERSKLEKILMSPITFYVATISLLIAVGLNIFRIATLFGRLEWNILLASLLFVAIAMGATLLVCKVIIFVVDRFFKEKLEKRAQDRWKRKRDEEDQKRKKEEMAFQSTLSFFYEQRLQPLACTERSREATLASLPESHRTMWLRFMDLKVKVCKPFRG